MGKRDLALSYVKFIEKTKYWILGLWIVLIIISVPLAISLFDHLNMENEAPAGSKAAEARRLFDSEFKEDEYQTSIVILKRDEGSVLTPEAANFTFDLIQRLNGSAAKDRLDHTSFMGYFLIANSPIDAQDPSVKFRFVSSDNDSMFISYRMKETDPDEEMVDDVRGILRDITPKGYRAYFFDNDAIHIDTVGTVVEDIGRIDIVVVPLILIVLFIVFRNIKLVPFPLISIGITILFAMAILSVIARYMPVITFVPTIMSSIGLGVGVDYALFMLARFQEERRKGASVFDSTYLMVKHAGFTIIASGLTLAAAFLGLAFFPINIISSIGLAISLIVFLTLINNLIFLTALTLVLGGWLCKGNSCKEPMTRKESGWRKLARFSSRYAVAIIVVAVLAATPLAFELSKIEVTDNSEDLFPSSTGSYSAYQTLKSEFSMTMTRPLEIVIKAEPGVVWTNAFYNETSAFIDKMAADHEVSASSIMSIFRINGNVVPFSMIELARAYPSMSEIERNIALSQMSLQNRSAFIAYMGQYLDYVSTDQDAVRISINLNVPTLSNEAKDWVQKARSDYVDEYFGDRYEVGFYGYTAESMDIVDTSYHFFPWMVVIVLIVIYILIFAMFRSVFIPIRLILTIGVTMSFIFGLSYLFLVEHWASFILDDINNISGIYWILPILSFCIILGLGLDYDLFVLSRVREAVWNGRTTKEAVSDSLDTTGKLVTGAGAIMVVAFGGMMLSTMLPIKEVGFIIGIAVLLDATVVRILLVPAIMSVADKWNWWPAKPPKGITPEGVNEV
jgi:RND superfamily putative drug exporter